MKNILIINTEKSDLLPLFDCWENLSARGYNFSIVASDFKIINKFKEKKWPAKIIPEIFIIGSMGKIFLFLFLFPLVAPLSLIFLFYLKYGLKIKTIILGCCSAKLAFTFLAKILSLKAIWLELPGENNIYSNYLIKIFLMANSRWAEIIGFTELKKLKLINNKWKKENIKIIRLGLKQKSMQLQNNIFSELAWTEKRHSKQKFLTIGSIIDLDSQKLGSTMETFFQAIKKSLTIIPHMQIIIVGDGEEKKNLAWLTKKMGINNLVWFVGKASSPGVSNQNQIKKWLDGFDIFFAGYENLNLDDINILLLAKENKLPIIAFADIGLENYIQNNNAIFTNLNDSEMLAQKIINLYKNKNLRISLSQASYDDFIQNFTTEKMAQELEKIIS